MSYPANLRGWGPGWPVNRSADMVWVEAFRSHTRFHVHREIAPILQFLIDEIERRGYLFDYGPGDVNDDWSYVNRPIGGTRKPSNHSWGLAIDMDAQKYPQHSKARPPQWIIDLFKAYGFEAGADWSPRYVDPMHFEFAGSITEARLIVAMLAAGHVHSKPAPVPATVPPPLPAVDPQETPVHNILICDKVGIVHVIDGLGSFINLDELKLIREAYKKNGVKLLEQNVSKARLDQMMRR